MNFFILFSSYEFFVYATTAFCCKRQRDILSKKWKELKRVPFSVKSVYLKRLHENRNVYTNVGYSITLNIIKGQLDKLDKFIMNFLLITYKCNKPFLFTIILQSFTYNSLAVFTAG